MNEFQGYMIDFMFQYVFLNMLSLTTATFYFQIWIVGSVTRWFKQAAISPGHIWTTLYYKNVIFKVLVVAIMKIPVFWDVLLCNFICCYNIYRTGCVTAMLKACLLEVLGSDLGPDTRYPDWGFCGFPKSLQANVGLVSQWNLDHYLPQSFHFINHPIFWFYIDLILMTLLNNQLKWNS
jgi:hypothetical protein